LALNQLTSASGKGESQLHGDAGDLAVALGAVGVTEGDQGALDVDGQAQGGPGGHGGLVDVAQVLRRLGERQAPLPAGRDPDRAQERRQRHGHRAAGDGQAGHPVAVRDPAQLGLERRLQAVALVLQGPEAAQPAQGRPQQRPQRAGQEVEAAADLVVPASSRSAASSS
jgi:hypothetical protein